LIKIKLTKAKLFPGISKEVRVLEIKHDYDKALIASDLHCEDSCRILSLLYNLALKKRCDALVILGDLFEDYHQTAKIDEVKEKVLNMIGFKDLRQTFNLIYLLSSASHDPIIPRPSVKVRNGLKLILSPYPVILRISGLRIIATHGEIMISNGALVHMINLVLWKLGVKLAVEKITRKALCLNSSEWLISGHTHIPGIDPKYKVANAGSWKLSWRKGLRYWRPSTFSYIEVEGKCLKLRMISWEREHIRT